MDLLELIIDFHIDGKRQGPGSDEATKKALSFIPQLNEHSQILDIGCGTGAQTMILAQNTNANIIAVDMLPQFLGRLNKKIDDKNLNNRVGTKCLSMDSLPFEEKSFDVIWSEGAIYNIGFEKGLSQWRKYLKDNGYIAVSEISWLTDTRPSEIDEYWINAYSEIDTIDTKLSIIEKCGYTPITHFALDDHCWIDNYYKPIFERSEAFINKYNYSKEVKEFVEAGKIEAEMYTRFKEYYSYVFYIAKRVG
ncbi:methyltransferase domain-containing protein [Schnuerera sp. xch1]|uniref:class I SAM-dependent methyltransferase n=1 Tax=Schnuerera sp. xch1 TaxID=2874283 RepID=UPI001CBBCB28|nr:class I SAM-dependent methyltransferase [Schnuerera sp. xch1]MBZ2174286.1 methyltransferase domain-containing protein [Schnuerera sp. xch1]